MDLQGKDMQWDFENWLWRMLASSRGNNLLKRIGRALEELFRGEMRRLERSAKNKVDGIRLMPHPAIGVDAFIKSISKCLNEVPEKFHSCALAQRKTYKEWIFEICSTPNGHMLLDKIEDFMRETLDALALRHSEALCAIVKRRLMRLSHSRQELQARLGKIPLDDNIQSRKLSRDFQTCIDAHEYREVNLQLNIADVKSALDQLRQHVQSKKTMSKPVLTSKNIAVTIGGPSGKSCIETSSSEVNGSARESSRYTPPEHPKLNEDSLPLPEDEVQRLVPSVAVQPLSSLRSLPAHTAEPNFYRNLHASVHTSKANKSLINSVAQPKRLFAENHLKGLQLEHIKLQEQNERFRQISLSIYRACHELLCELCSEISICRIRLEEATKKLKDNRKVNVKNEEKITEMVCRNYFELPVSFLSGGQRSQCEFENPIRSARRQLLQKYLRPDEPLKGNSDHMLHADELGSAKLRLHGSKLNTDNILHEIKHGEPDNPSSTEEPDFDEFQDAALDQSAAKSRKRELNAKLQKLFRLLACPDDDS